MRNDIEEDFVLDQKHFKCTVIELLRVIIKSKHPLMNNIEVSEIVNNKICGYIEKREWTEIIKYLYHKEDYLNLVSTIHKNCKTVKKENYKLETIKFTSMLNVLLEFQLKTHEHSLKAFRERFAKYDDDCDGILTKKQMVALTQDLHTESNIQGDLSKILQKVAPYSASTITFSQAVSTCFEPFISLFISY